MDKFSWIKDLVTADQQMQDAGIVDLTVGDDPDSQLEDATVDFLCDLKLEFLKAIAAFNQLSGSAMGPIRVYAVAKTKADFMIFRNGTKLIFSMKSPGRIAVSHQVGVTVNDSHETILLAEPFAFGQMRWTVEGHPINVDYLIRFYVEQFVKVSASSQILSGKA